MTHAELEQLRELALAATRGKRYIGEQDGCIFAERTTADGTPTTAVVGDVNMTWPDVEFTVACGPEEALGLLDEIARLTECLSKANANHEEYERRWYLATEERDALIVRRDELLAAMVKLTREVPYADEEGKRTARAENERDHLKRAVRAALAAWCPRDPGGDGADGETYQLCMAALEGRGRHG